MNIAYIMRGVSGSGKSTLAKQLAGKTGVVHSTDDYFYVNGRYLFDPTLLSEYHARNLEAFCRSLDAKISIVICDNTNVCVWHFEQYVTAAEQSGYLVVVVSVPHPVPEIAAQRNSHGVPVEVIQQMIEKWEPYPPIQKTASRSYG